MAILPFFSCVWTCGTALTTARTGRSPIPLYIPRPRMDTRGSPLRSLKPVHRWSTSLSHRDG